MAPLTPYHFARPRPEGFRRFYREVRSLGGAVCFDLEDSVYSPDPVACRALKDRRRREVVALLQGVADEPDGAGLYVRVNAPDTEHYARDVAALGALGRLPGVFLPKVERAVHLTDLLQALPHGLPGLIPVVESRAGFAALAEVLAVDHRAFAVCAFGHCDYNLDLGHFPFHHQNSDTYWTWLARLDAAAQAVGKGVLNSPVLRLDDVAFFRGVLRRLAGFPAVRGQITLSMTQTRLCSAARTDETDSVPDAAASADVAAAARQVVDGFRQHRVSDSYFALDPRRTLISPHEYRAALGASGGDE